MKQRNERLTNLGNIFLCELTNVFKIIEKKKTITIFRFRIYGYHCFMLWNLILIQKYIRSLRF